ncbi:MAG: hypothetical protein KDD94_11350 [Calditrichaeota bacterium]|nr:hypothetical protein [Calditrichota bacterium]
MRYLFLILLLMSCRTADDPVSMILSSAKRVSLIQHPQPIDPARADSITAIHRLLFQTLEQIAVISTTDSLLWLIELKSTPVNSAARKQFTIDDIAYSFKQNRSHLLLEPGFSKLRKFERIDESSCSFRFAEKFDFALVAANLFFVFSSDYSFDDIPLGNGEYQVLLKPEKDQYILIPYTDFHHLIEDAVERVIWLYTTKKRIEENQFRFKLGDLNRYKEESLE